MKTTLISKDQNKGISPTLYDARLNFNQINTMSSIFKMRSQLLKIDRNIGCAHVIPDNPLFHDNSLTKYGLQLVGSPLSYQLPPIDINITTISNLVRLTAMHEISIEQLPDYLPVVLLD